MMLRTMVAMVACLVCLSACSGGVDEEAVKSDIAKYKKQLAALNADKVTLMEKNTSIKTANFKAMANLKGAERSKDESKIASAKAAYEEAAAAAQEAVDAEKALDDRIRDLKDKIRALEKKLR